jgi:hypothetical protein
MNGLCQGPDTARNRHLPSFSGLSGREPVQQPRPVFHIYCQHSSVQFRGGLIHQLATFCSDAHRVGGGHHARRRQRGDLAQRMAQHQVRLPAALGQVSKIAKGNGHQQRLEPPGLDQLLLRPAKADWLQVFANELAGEGDQAAEGRIRFEQVGPHADFLRTLAGKEKDLHSPAGQATAAVNPPSTTMVWPMM